MGVIMDRKRIIENKALLNYSCYHGTDTDYHRKDISIK